MANQIELIYAKQAEEQLKKVLSGLTDIHKKQMELNANAIDFYGGRASGSPNELNAVISKYDELAKKYKDLEAKLQKLNERKTQVNQRTAEEIVNQRILAQNADRQARSTSNLVGAYQRLNAQHQISKKNLQDLIASGTASNAQLRKAQAEYDKLDARIKKADAAVRVFNRNVGNYPQNAIMGLKNLMSAFGLFGGIYLFAAALKNGFQTVKDFDKANADLAATMGKSRKEITALTNDQKRLGASTKFTASEVAGLQKEFAKLGFSQQEILNATEATLALAAATDTDLARAAEVAGATLRGFGLDASEMARVTDVMASGFTKSALDMSNFAESMKYVAPIAGQTGVSIEFATAMLGKLADAGVKGSQAGTSLRRILTEMAKTGLPAAEAFDKVAKSGISVTDAMDEVGRTAQTALLVLSKSKDGVNELAEALENAGGAAQRMADEQLDSLEGKITLLTSAWDGFILSIENGEGIIGSFISKAISGLTKILNIITEANKSQKQFNEEIKNNDYKDAKNNVFEYARSVAEAGKNRYKTEKEYNERIREIEVQDAEFRKKLTQERLKEENQKLLGAIKNLEIYKKNLYSPFAILSIPQITKQKQLVKQLEANVNGLIGEIEAYNDIINGSTQITEKEIEVTNNSTKSKEKKKKATKELEQVELNSQIAFERNIKALNDQLRATNKASIEYGILELQIKLLKDAYDALYGSKKKVTELTYGTIPYYENEIKLLKEIQDTVKDPEEFAKYEKQIKFYQTIINWIKGIKDETKEVKNETDEWLDSYKKGFSDDFISQSGFDKLFFLIENFDKLKEDGVATALAISEAFQQAFNTISSYSDANYERMYANLERQRDTAILFAGESTTAKEEIERVYEERRKRIQRQQAEAQKRLAMFNIAINTAQGITSALAMLPPNIPLAVTIGIIGAAQLALTASQQIPQFAVGTQNAPEGLAWTDEKGAELHTDKNGKIKDLGSNKGARLKKLEKGDKIYTASQTKKMLDLYSFNKQYDNIMLSNGISVAPQVGQTIDFNPLKQEIRDLGSIIKNKSEVTIVNNESGQRYYERVNGQKRELVNSVLTLKTRTIR